MRIMGLDVGEKRIGIAICDPMGWTAQGHSTLHRKNLSYDLQQIKEICDEYEVEKIVLGYPRNMNGTVGPKAMEIEGFGNQIAEKTNLPIDYWDERLSTVMSEKVLLQADVSRKKRRGVIDKLAAVTILQGYLDRLSNK
ncbi:MAG: Holliday junction resolvase RuvX [Bacillota bacterium]|nr:Holliday junction resolvase RuvX [Bacillota bacterium]